MKKPKQLRDDIRALTRHLTQVREVLLKRSDIEIAQIGKECKRTADSIGELLKTQELPNDYKVAVVGRFKTGKSSFVNELLGAKLANEDRTYALMTTVNYADCRSWCFGYDTVEDANFKAPSDSQMHLADVHGIFDE